MFCEGKKSGLRLNLRGIHAKQKKKASGALPNNFYKKKACLFQLNSRNDMLPVFIVKTQKEKHVTS